jgi:ubiquinone/menaquinone biosynthesis C-methylase UbiE
MQAMDTKSTEHDEQALRIAQLFDSMGSDYESAFAHDAGLNNFIRKVLTIFPPASSVLDVGCGTGTPVSKTIAAHGHKVTGIDIAPKMVELSRKAVPNGTFELADMLEYVPKQKMDVVLNILSLFMLSRREMETMSKKWAEWLLPNGLLCICMFAAEDCNPTKDMYDEDGLCASGMPFMFMGQQGLLTMLTRQGWEKMLEHAGFEIVDTEVDLFEPPAEAKSDPEPHYFIIARRLS